MRSYRRDGLNMNPSAILAQLDQAAQDFEFPMLDNGYVYPADTRMSIFRDETRWLMMIEALGVGNRANSGVDLFCNCLHLYGNALHRQPGTNGGDFLYPIPSLPEDPLFADEYDWE